IAILKENDRGGYTIPTRGLYPFQWNWDSAFVALGFATFDEIRAWQEIESLMEGQWLNGFLPHIVFRRDDPDYFPGPVEWGTERHHWIPTSGITQPPVLATIVRELFMTGTPAIARERARAIFPKVLAWHRWYHSPREIGETGMIAVAHPWESGRDNLPDWDLPLHNVDISDLVPYERKDVTHVNQDMRPQQFDYDRYVRLVHFGRDNAWDGTIMKDQNPFWVADVGVTAILLRADRDLLAMAHAFEFVEAVSEIEAWIARGEEGIDRLWNDQVFAYTSFDVRTDQRADMLNGGTLLPFYAGVADPLRVDILFGHMDRWWQRCEFGVPSFDPDHRLFDSIRYWRGPIWAVVNWLIARGLRDMGYEDRAARVQDNTISLIEAAGFRENFCPATGLGCGGHDFSWTAAIWLNLKHDAAQRAAA
ncbi:MAG: trehalase family glycosidase, partial [Pseudomonadota bacterium]